MKMIWTFVVALTTFVSVCDAALYDVLSARLIQPQSYFRGVTALSNGDAVSVGYVNGVVGTPYGLSDFIVQRSTPNGTVVWTKQWGSASWDYAIYVVRDSSDNIYVSGYAGASFDGHTFNGGNQDCVVFKLDSAGNKLFSSQFGTTGQESASAISIDQARGFLYATGYTIKQGSPDQSFLAKLDMNTGVLLKKIDIVSVGTYLFGSGTDSAGGVWVGGFTQDYSYYGASGGGSVVQRFDQDLNSTFATVMGGANAYHFGTDAEDNKYLCGLSGGGAFAARYNSAGVKVWSTAFGGPGGDGAMGSVADLATGRLYVTGGTKSPVFLGKTNVNIVENTFLVVLSIADGSILYSELYGTAGAHSRAMAIATSGPFTYFSGAADGSFQGNAASTSAEHAFVVALSTPSIPTVEPTTQPTASPSAPPCVLWALADYGETCSATCSSLQRVCKPKYFETVVTQEGFYDAVGAAVNVRAGGSPIGSAQAFCSQATTASTSVSVPSVITMVLNAAGNDPVRRTCTYPTSAATDCDAALPVSSSVRRLCPCVDHNCDDAFYLGYSGDSCGATCSNVARTCDAEKLSEIVDATSFSAMVASTTAVDTNAPIGASAESFCTLGTNLLNVSTAPAALTFVQGAVNQTLCAFPTSAELLHGDCDVSFTGAFPAQRFCNCRVPVNPAHRQLTALPPLNEKVAEVVHSAPVVVSPRLRRV